MDGSSFGRGLGEALVAAAILIGVACFVLGAGVALLIRHFT